MRRFRKLLAGAALAVCAFFGPCDSVATAEDMVQAAPVAEHAHATEAGDMLDDLGIGGAAALEGGMLAAAVAVLWKMHVASLKREHERADKQGEAATKATETLIAALQEQAKVAREADSANRAGLADVKAELGAVRTEIGKVREAMGEEIRKVREDMDSRFETVHKDIRELTDRVEDLEGPARVPAPSSSTSTGRARKGANT